MDSEREKENLLRLKKNRKYFQVTKLLTENEDMCE